MTAQTCLIMLSWFKCSRDIYALVSLLLESNIPHNLVMLRGDAFNQDPSEFKCGTVIKILLIPRKPTYGMYNKHLKLFFKLIYQFIYFNIWATFVSWILMCVCVCVGLKSVYESDSVPPFFAAACELGLGFIPVVGGLSISQSIVNT